CYAVEKTFKSGRSIMDYYAVGTHLLVGREGPRWNETSKSLIGYRILFLDHKAVGGIVLPHRDLTYFSGIEIDQRWSNFRWNEPIDDAKFQPKL
ncbi:MAG TPA: hypothetical protein PK264_05385, partial [Hyphomicrobiaceae bacterium]|nr:hypothetical protein [Hyphomicrobiaceae bacterium]